MQKPVIIFDFDGTVANTLDSIIDVMNGLADEFGFKKIQQLDIEYLRGKNAKEILKHLEISLFKLPFVLRRARKEIHSHIETLHPTVDLLSTLKILRENNCQTGIVTTNSQENVKKFLSANNLSDQFDFIFNSSKVFGKHKTISKIIKEKNLKKSDVYFICDEIRDIQAGKKAKIKTIAVSWGYNTQNALLAENPDYMINSSSDIEKIILFGNEDNEE